MNKLKKISNVFLIIICAWFMSLSYGIIQDIAYIFLLVVVGPIFPEVLKYLSHYEFLADCILMIPLLVLYGWIFFKFLYKNSKPAKPINATDKLVVKRNLLRDGGFCLIIAIGTLEVSNIWFIFVEKFLLGFDFWKKTYDSFIETWDGVNDGDYVWMLLSVVLIGPIVEEFLFRGVIFNMLKKVNATWLPIIGSGLLFGLFHVEPIQVVYTSVMGILLGFVYAKTGRFEICLGIHIANNLLSELNSHIPDKYMLHFYIFSLIIGLIPGIYRLIKLGSNGLKPQITITKENPVLI